MRSERYPVVRSKPLEKGFPVATFSWRQVDVQDSGEMPERIFDYPDGEVFAYPHHAVLFDCFARALRRTPGRATPHLRTPAS